MAKRNSFVVCLSLVSLFIFGQADTNDIKISMFSANLGYSMDLPAGDMKDRFGQSLSVNTGVEYLFDGRNSLGLVYNYNFGSNVKEDVFKNYRNEFGQVIGINGYASSLVFRQRGSYLGINYGRMFRKEKKTSGLKLVVGAGLMTHKIRAQDDSRSLAIADYPFFKGFDRFSKGLALQQELLYQYHSSKKALHFNIGFSILEGFTTQVRKVNFDTGEIVSKNRLDILYGLRFTWMIPLSKNIAGTVKYF